MDNSISNYDDIIDSRDVIERIAELEDDDNRSESDNKELAALNSLAEDAADYCDDWEHGAFLIRYSFFKEYAQELADDIGAIDRNANWPTNCIDWDQAARELQIDYAAVEFDGITYWVR